MEYVSSDTNVWIDFSVIDREQLPFLLLYIYIMNEDAIEDELLSPIGLCDRLLRHGLVKVNISEEEFMLAEEYGGRYLQLSVHDRIALSIAKRRGIRLLTGDGALRKAAKKENVEVMGTLGILDELFAGGCIVKNEYESCLKALHAHNGSRIRLPSGEITLRLHRL